MDIIKPILGSLILLLFIFIASTFIWIFISDFILRDFFIVLQLIFKKIGIYSTLLAGIIVSIFYNSFTAVKAKNKEIEEKIRNRINSLKENGKDVAVNMKQDGTIGIIGVPINAPQIYNNSEVYLMNELTGLGVLTKESWDDVISGKAYTKY